MSKATYITDEMEAAVGSELSRQVSFPITTSDIRRWAIAIYFPEPPPPLFWDESLESGAGISSAMRPPVASTIGTCSLGPPEARANQTAAPSPCHGAARTSTGAA